MSAVPEPLYFGDSRAPIAGWIHRPDTGATPPIGLVLCPPLFHEGTAAYRAMRHLAESAADHGIVALRFDYQGTRDSSGGSTDADCVSAWTASVGRAIDTIKTAGGVDRVCLAGIRLGATLAAIAARGRDDVAALIAIVPVVKGRVFLRELTAFGLRGATVAEPAGWHDVGGFQISSETRDAIAALDLLSIHGAVAPRVLVIDRADLPSDGAWPAHLERGGSRVDRRRATGFAEMMEDPHRSVLPARLIRLAIDWLSREFRCAASAPADDAARSSSRSPSPHSACLAWHDGNAAAVLRETVCYLDDAGELFAVITERPPDASKARPQDRAVILMLNAGAVPHFGPGRLYVSLARVWAADGHVVVRMDLAGLGDSPARPGESENVVYPARALEDIGRALAFIRRRHPGTRCLVAGICSGAYHGFKAAVEGLPVDGVIAINPLTFFWREGMSLDGPGPPAGRPPSASGSRRGIVRAAARACRSAGREFLARSVYAGRELGRWLHLPVQNDLAAELKRAVGRRVSLLFVFSAGDPGQELLHDQAGPTLARLMRRGALRVQVIDGADHTFSRQSAKDRLIALLSGRAMHPGGLGT